MSNQIRCIVVDDEQIARNIMLNYIEKLPQLQLVGQCKNPFDALVLLQSESVDLIFLDIQMPQLTGIEFYKSLQKKPMVILTTAYTEYAMEGFSMDVVDYLLKPFRFDRFVEAVNKASRRWKGENTNIASAIPAPANPSKTVDYLLIKADHKIHKVKFNDILYIEGMKEYVAFHLPEGRILTILTLKQLDNELPKHLFIRIHKSFIVAIDRVKALEGNMVHIGKEKLPICGLYRQEILGRIFK